MCACGVPHQLPYRGQDEKLSLVTNDMVSILRWNYAGEFGLLFLYTRAKALINLYDRIGEQSIEGHARFPYKIKKITHSIKICLLWT